jgi:SAM-dependent methyltransferase
MITYACPVCSAPLEQEGGVLRCPRDGYTNVPVDGIRDFLSDDAAALHDDFLAEYRAIRRAEHRGSDDPAYYLALPNVPADDPMRKEWALRRESAVWIREQFNGMRGEGGMKILDAGAGNCWLTWRMVEWGNEVVALDLNTDLYDGLAAGRHYLNALPIAFDRVRADFNHLPFHDTQFDAVVFNGSFHYSDRRLPLIQEARRVTRPGGTIFIIDSPIYRDRSSGEKMLAERAVRGRAGFLTVDELHDLARDAGLAMEIHSSKPGPLSKLKRRLTELRLGREVATMARVRFSLPFQNS